ncbi:MAG TPA: DHH family phosphoesterase [Methanosarcinaceae archaeon]|nr:DHH family phosphoesterase [Methanosarcinaceae archaeon]
MAEIQKLTELAKQVADVISGYSHVRVISHNDADGITSAAIICQALQRNNIQFHATIVSRLDESIIDMVNSTASEGDLVVFCDMGCGQSDLIEKVSFDVVIIDHHQPVGDSPAKIAINPHFVGIDGAIHLSASGTTYMVARQMDEGNVDLAGLAIAGAVGDKQLFESANLSILDEALGNNVISIKKGLKVGSGDVADVLEYTSEPYLDITGDRKKIDAFLDILNIHGEIGTMSADDLKKLTSAVALKLTKNASPEAVDAAIGDVYILDREAVPNSYDLVAILNTCGKMDKSGLALSLCMKDASVIDEARALSVDFQKSTVTNIKKAEGMLQQGKNMWYLNAHNMESTGIIASTVVRYIHPDQPFVAINEVEDIVKVSARGTRALIAAGLDLSYALREGAKAVGGSGGGHNIASGAAIPKGKSEEFISIVDDIIGEQLRTD